MRMKDILHDSFTHVFDSGYHSRLHILLRCAFECMHVCMHTAQTCIYMPLKQMHECFQNFHTHSPVTPCLHLLIQSRQLCTGAISGQSTRSCHVVRSVLSFTRRLTRCFETSANGSSSSMLQTYFHSALQECGIAGTCARGFDSVPAHS